MVVAPLAHTASLIMKLNVEVRQFGGTENG